MGNVSLISPLAAVVAALALAGCAGGSMGSFPGFGSPQPEQAAVQPLPAPEIPATIRSCDGVGRWGYAAF